MIITGIRLKICKQNYPKGITLVKSYASNDRVHSFFRFGLKIEQG